MTKLPSAFDDTPYLLAIPSTTVLDESRLLVSLRIQKDKEITTVNYIVDRLENAALSDLLLNGPHCSDLK